MLMTSMNTHLNAPLYLEHIPKSADRVRALCALTIQLHTATIAASLASYKLLLALASLFQEPKIWLPVPFRTGHHGPAHTFSICCFCTLLLHHV